MTKIEEKTTRTTIQNEILTFKKHGRRKTALFMFGKTPTPIKMIQAALKHFHDSFKVPFWK